MLGRIYRYITLLLGMKPGQHEYKVMGLAPYGTEYHGKNSLNFSGNLILLMVLKLNEIKI